MFLLTAFVAAVILMYFHKMRRAEAMLARLSQPPPRVRPAVVWRRQAATFKPAARSDQWPSAAPNPGPRRLLSCPQSQTRLARRGLRLRRKWQNGLAGCVWPAFFRKTAGHQNVPAGDPGEVPYHSLIFRASTPRLL